MHEPLTPGTLFCDRYEVVRVIDSGGMGIVYEVLDNRTRRRRALKTIQAGLAANPDIRARFDLEATATAGIRSDHLVEVLDSGVDPAAGMPYLVMELLEGDNLGALLKKQGACAPKVVIDCLQQVAWALDKMHDAGIVHRDLKPENLILTLRDDGLPSVKIIDFGIVKVVVQSSAAQTTRNVGTPCYMSPEQIRGDGNIDKRADLYALGHIAFALLTGRAYWEIEPCYQKGPVPLLARILQGGKREHATERARSIGSWLPSSFDDWFDRATAQVPSERHPSARQLVQELADALGLPLGSAPGNRVSGDEPNESGAEAGVWRARSRRLLLVIAACAILLLTLATLVSHSRRVVSVGNGGSEASSASRAALLVAPVSSHSAPIDSAALPAASLDSVLVEASSMPVVPLGHQRLRSKPGVTRAAAAIASPSAAGAELGPHYDPTDER
jgi:serine/threonine protein kinase